MTVPPKANEPILPTCPGAPKKPGHQYMYNNLRCRKNLSMKLEEVAGQVQDLAGSLRRVKRSIDLLNTLDEDYDRIKRRLADEVCADCEMMLLDLAFGDD
jgi:hypothetical protein